MLQINKFKELFVNIRQKPYAIPVSLILMGVLLVLAVSITSNASGATTENSTDAYKYIENLEKNLEKNISRINNIEDCSVMITVSSVEDKEYLKNSTVSSSTDSQSEEYTREKEYLVIESGGEDTVIVESTHMPEICGALVVYTGKNDIETQKKVIDAVSTVLGIQSNKVCVISN